MSKFHDEMRAEDEARERKGHLPMVREDFIGKTVTHASDWCGAWSLDNAKKWPQGAAATYGERP